MPIERDELNPQSSGREWAERLFGCLDKLRVGQRLIEWADAAEADGRSDEAGAHRQVWTDFVEMLDEFVRALGDEPMGVEEFREALEAGLAEFNLGLAPATLDQVLVGAIERSRQPPVRAVLLLGFDESQFPLRRSEDPLLGDGERAALEGAGIELGPPRRRQLLDERMLAYIALTRASERLWISYPLADTDGKPLQPSPYLGEVLAALPGLQVEKLVAPGSNRCPDPMVTRLKDLGSRLAAELRYRPALEQDRDLDARGLWNGLYEAARRREEWRSDLARSLTGLKYRNEAALEPGLMTRALGEDVVLSVSRLERLASCPFAHFVEYTLKLKPRVEADLGHLDLGTLCHAVLEEFVGDLARDNRRLADLEDAEIIERIDAVAGKVAPLLAEEMMLTGPRNAYLFDRSRGQLRRAARWQRDAARVGRFRPAHVEYPFGFDDAGIAPLTLTTPGGRTVRLRGKIDRVDLADLGSELAGVVIDYKRTRDRKLDLVHVYHGLALQLVGYLLALQQTGESLAGRPIRPVGAFYLPLLEPYETLRHPTEEKSKGYRCRGISDAAAIEILDESAAAGENSQFFSMQLTREGRPYKRCDLVSSERFAHLMTHVGRRMGELADRLFDGDVAIAPYRLSRHTPCSYCEYKPVCRFEPDTQPARELESVDRSVIFGEASEDADDE